MWAGSSAGLHWEGVDSLPKSYIALYLCLVAVDRPRVRTMIVARRQIST
jgi:hypothetical protein